MNVAEFHEKIKQILDLDFKFIDRSIFLFKNDTYISLNADEKRKFGYHCPYPGSYDGALTSEFEGVEKNYTENDIVEVVKEFSKMSFNIQKRFDESDSFYRIRHFLQNKIRTDEKISKIDKTSFERTIKYLNDEFQILIRFCKEKAKENN